MKIPWLRQTEQEMRALPIERRLEFTQNYPHANQRFREARLDERNRPRQDEFDAPSADGKAK